MSEERPIPEARLRPRGAGEEARAAGADGARWLGKRARGLGRVARGIALAGCMLVPAVLIGTLRTDYRSRGSYDFDQDMQRLRRSMENLDRMRLDSDALLRGLELPSVPTYDPSRYQLDMDPAPAPTPTLEQLTDGYSGIAPEASDDELRAGILELLDRTAAGGAAATLAPYEADSDSDADPAPAPAPIRTSRPGHDLAPER